MGRSRSLAVRDGDDPLHIIARRSNALRPSPRIRATRSDMTFTVKLQPAERQFTVERD